MMEENQQSGESKMDDKNDIHQEDTIQDDVEHDVEDDGMDVTEDTLMTVSVTMLHYDYLFIKNLREIRINIIF